MSDTASNPCETIADGGFRIEITPKSITVTKDKTAWEKRKKSSFSRVVQVAFVAILFLSIFIRLLTDLNSRSLVIIGIFGLLMVPSVVFGRLTGTNNIRCTLENLEVIRLLRGRETGRWLFPRADVIGIHFAAVSNSRYGSTCALLFKVEGKKVEVLRGIEIPEAQTLLHQLKRLGFDVTIDVAMPMAAEMALERRNSWLS